MKAELLIPDDDQQHYAAPNGSALVEDLALAPLFEAMAGGDPFLREVVETVLPRSLGTGDAIRYRQQILADCVANPAAVRHLYEMATAAAQVRRWTGRDARSKLSLSLEPLTELAEHVRRLRASYADYAPQFRSDGLTRLGARLTEQLGDDYLDSVEKHIDELGFEHGMQISAGLGPGNKAVDVVMHEPLRRRRLLGADRPAGQHFRVANDDELGTDYLNALINTGLQTLADHVSAATDAVQDFFRSLRAELGFYLGCLNLRDRLTAAGYPLCTPIPVAHNTLRCTGLRDPVLCLTTGGVAGNAIDGHASLVVVTGANSGGKSTFLRSAGVAQVMAQAGMFVVAEAFEADVRAGIFTHFRAEEDATMTHGKFVEELARMRDLTDRIAPTSLVLLNEPFSSTDEREAAEIAGPILRAMLDAGIKIVLVTHLFDLADGLYTDRRPDDLFLRAERRTDGTRTFQLIAQKPLPTSHGGDTYRRIFGDDHADTAIPPRSVV
ncbi:MutS-related protein [Nocardia altamirensis]|uniref:MutS-related protein n=1 Tax=Nocardia altamirensis TaxID=472158 RepID=UPI0008404FDF|nr:hypothetical protein [Nocardia altamirensis]